MIVVIADDVTGAAEIAGVALRHGKDVKFATELRLPLPQADVLVMATDTRSGTEAEAVAEVTALAKSLKGQQVRIFKKTDSALRGHIAAELSALMAELGISSSLLIAQNPSKGRVIRKGRYFIGDQELHLTSFSFDPEFPALTSVVEQRLPGVHSLALDGEMTDGVNAADAASAEEIRLQLAKADGTNAIVAGAADCFEAFLASEALSEGDDDVMAGVKSALIVCGSTQSKSLAEEPLIKRVGAEEIGMTEVTFHGGDPSEWLAQLMDSYRRNGSLVMKIGHEATGGREYAMRLRSLMSEATCTLVGDHRPDLLVIEGGATAFATLKALGWDTFTICHEFAPGVVGMRYGDTLIVLKPGSYSWGNLFKA